MATQEQVKLRKCKLFWSTSDASNDFTDDKRDLALLKAMLRKKYSEDENFKIRQKTTHMEMSFEDAEWTVSMDFGLERNSPEWLEIVREYTTPRVQFYTEYVITYDPDEEYKVFVQELKKCFKRGLSFA